MSPTADFVEIAALEAELKSCIKGEIDFTTGGRALYTSDASNYRQIPIGIVCPRTIEEIVAVTRICHRHTIPLLMRGAGTSQNGQCVNVAVVLDCSRHLNTVVKLDVDRQLAVVEPGLICDDLKAHAEQYGLTFGPDPGTHSRCTLGGMIGNNSCGPHSMLAGKTVENVDSLEVLSYDGARFWVGATSEEELEQIIASGGRQADIYRELRAIRDEYADEIRARFPKIKRRVSGYNLDQLLPENGFHVARALVGSEGTCVSVLQARVHLIHNPIFQQCIVLGFQDIFTAGDSVPAILPFSPIAMEGLDWGIVGGLLDRNLKREEIALLPEGKAWLIVELAADSSEELLQLGQAFKRTIASLPGLRSSLFVTNDAAAKRIWSIRELGASATSMSLDPEGIDPVVGWEDTAVDPLQLGAYLREFQALIDQYDYDTNLYGHFGDGCIHARITFDTRSHAGLAKWRSFSNKICQLVLKYGGSLSGEHGDGQAKAEFLPLMYGPRLMRAFERFKAVWDPANKMNPGKLIQPRRMDQDLRFGPDYATPSVATAFAFPDDAGGFGRAVERCIGMGKCRSSGTAMCPSFQATREERYSTRGRAHLLHELMRNEVIVDGWDSESVADSLAHCLSCKACKTDCPTQVDVASYKAEFMSKRYAQRRRPLAHYAFGRLGDVLPMLSRFPALTNAGLRHSWSSGVLSKGLGLSDDTRLPLLATQPFDRWARAHCEDSHDDFHWFNLHGHSPVILWVDTFNNYYRPDLLRTAVGTLTRLSFRVGVARRRFCCGRPLYEYGFLRQARVQLNSILDGFYRQVPESASIVVLEASCLSVFKDELLNMIPGDERARDLSRRSMTTSDFLSTANMVPARRLGRGVLHLHCHHKAVVAGSKEREWLTACFDDLIEPENGCCGMAGIFGLKKNTRWISERLFRRRLGRRIEESDATVSIVANGFSCREQIERHTGRQALHPVEVAARCLALE
jgi:FAD/FMN-containing dehydrogenase/Fe-S oxidoreductase